MKFTPLHVTFVSESNSVNGIEIRQYLTKLETKLSWLRVYGSRCISVQYDDDL